MNGIDFLVDTNFLINISIKNPIVEPFLEYEFGISYITELELLGVFGSSKTQKENSKNLINNCLVFDMTHLIKQKTIEIKQNYKIKLPDAIIAATSIIHDFPLITSDADFKVIKELKLIFLEK